MKATIERIKKKDWFIYQAGLVLGCIFMGASIVAASYSQLLPIYPEHLKEAAFYYQLERGALLSGLAVLGSIIIDSTCVLLQGKGILGDDFFIES